MISSYFKIAWRNFKNNKVFSFINIVGLSVGLTCCMLITLYIINELSYDKYQQKGNDIYQIGTTILLQGKELKMANTPAAMGPIMQREFPEIVQQARLVNLFSDDKGLLQYRGQGGEAKSFYESKGYLVDSTFFRMFTYNFIEGNPASALNNPRTVVLSEDIARKLFGGQPALNKMIRISSSFNGDNDFLVTGVFRPINKPSHIDGRFFMSMMGGGVEKKMKRDADNLAYNNMYFTYLQLRPGTNIKNLVARFPAFLDKYAGKDLKAAGFGKIQFLIPLRNIHLYSGMEENVTPSGSLTYLYILGSIAVFTLLIACINFMNLSTARSSKRSAEVGIRKVLGAERRSLIRQFLGESLLMSIAAFVLALLITVLLLPAFNQVARKELSLTFTNNIATIAAFLGLSLIAGLLAGSYPAFYLASFKPVKVLKSKFSNSLAATSLRKGLVVFQFFISVFLIIATVVFAGQMHFLRSADLGFEKDNQLTITLQSETAKKNYNVLKSELSKQSQIADVSGASSYPGIPTVDDNLFYIAGESMKDAKRCNINYVDYSYLNTLGIRSVAGRIFSPQFPADTSNRIILNESAIQALGFKSAADAIGKNVFNDFTGKPTSFEIVGVVKDFHFEDLHLPIRPFGFFLNAGGGHNYMIVHLKPGDIDHALTAVGNTWHAVNPGEPFEYSFLDTDFQKNYEAESRLTSIVDYFTAVAILISCLGLFGLTTFSTEQRIKEIGVRKVLGATTVNIVTLLSKDFLKLVALAIVIASPAAWWAMNKWLQNFSYHISITWVVFAITTLAALFIALATMSFQAVRAALTNPVENLRTE